MTIDPFVIFVAGYLLGWLTCAIYLDRKDGRYDA